MTLVRSDRAEHSWDEVSRDEVATPKYKISWHVIYMGWNMLGWNVLEWNNFGTKCPGMKHFGMTGVDPLQMPTWISKTSVKPKSILLICILQAGITPPIHHTKKKKSAYRYERESPRDPRFECRMATSLRRKLGMMAFEPRILRWLVFADCFLYDVWAVCRRLKDVFMRQHFVHKASKIAFSPAWNPPCSCTKRQAKPRMYADLENPAYHVGKRHKSGPRISSRESFVMTSTSPDKQIFLVAGPHCRDLSVVWVHLMHEFH